MSITTRQTTRPVGALVRYHGSIRELHGELFVITSNYTAHDGVRCVSAQPVELPLSYSLSNARPSSFSMAETL